MIRQACFHCWGDWQGFDGREILIGKAQSDSPAMMSIFLLESVHQPSETPNRHPHCQILPLNIARA
jgi:hypothetical protein